MSEQKKKEGRGNGKGRRDLKQRGRGPKPQGRRRGNAVSQERAKHRRRKSKEGMEARGRVPGLEGEYLSRQIQEQKAQTNGSGKCHRRKAGAQKRGQRRVKEMPRGGGGTKHVYKARAEPSS